ncbi:hypothetical protein Achl_4375 (plasmid) [Pseudarthrobacter chlorophenolicus A6]|uniref:Uncharacterized protein n=1 Tax=Pseudarthrobacter chlorophenolicus (strain ATCC 700700 / DSM 12829 / CIP 107037 / JCM 12360 / KCTC 9906 / NCIMB 13794 / A6) TaxID=452863 RepID=B8HIS9_PSECP|nr:hypothetical protein [Pseudarthrobacter chlorophenolicus]ACL42326.1 hypothetical protein Achl_4375 [Pseudarthrobacter chlorophenolicus A6]SDQ16532.1 hypothetical protein SAMN04489738_0432 [Pseudarthrobacter chlorophenolicus]
MNPEALRVLAAVLAGVAVAGYFIAIIVIDRRHTAKLNKLRADYEASVAPHYAALMRPGKNKPGTIRTDARPNSSTTESDTP